MSKPSHPSQHDGVAEVKPASSGIDPQIRANLEAVFALKAGQPFPATSPPEWMNGNERLRNDWIEGYNRDEAAKAAVKQAEEEKKQAEMMRQIQEQIAKQQVQAPQWNGAPVPVGLPGGFPGAGQDNAQLNELLKSMGLPGPAGAPGIPPPSSGAWPGFPPPNAFPSQGPAFQQNQHQGQQSHHGYGSEDKKRKWDNSGAQQPARKMHDPDYKRGTKPCKFWMEGKCAKGEKCTFIHDPAYAHLAGNA